MFGRSEPLEIDCDAPPYAVVRACEQAGFHSPLDVAWHRLSRFRGGPEAIPAGHLWQWLFGGESANGRTCVCGQPVPPLDKYAFTFVTQRVAEYQLGQCPRCRTIFWEEE